MAITFDTEGMWWQKAAADVVMIAGMYWEKKVGGRQEMWRFMFRKRLGMSRDAIVSSFDASTNARRQSHDTHLETHRRT